jgi:hypothetical protein
MIAAAMMSAGNAARHESGWFVIALGALLVALVALGLFALWYEREKK